MMSDGDDDQLVAAKAIKNTVWPITQRVTTDATTD
jgi:hypothetical protein